MRYGLFDRSIANNAVPAALFTRLVPSAISSRQLAGGDDDDLDSDIDSRSDRNQTHKHTVTSPLTDIAQPFFGAMGCTAAIVFTCLGASYGTAKSGVGIAAMGVLRPDLIVKSASAAEDLVKMIRGDLLTL